MSGFFERMTQRAAGTEVRWQARPRAVFEPRSGPGPFAAPGPGDGSGVGGSWAAPGSSGSSSTPWGEGRDRGRARDDDVRLDGRGGLRSGTAGPLGAAGGLVRGASWWAVGEWSDGEGPRGTVSGGDVPRGDVLGGEVPGGGFDRTFDGDRPGWDGFDQAGFGDDVLGPDELGGGRPGRGPTGSGPSGWDGPGRRGRGGEQQGGDRATATRGGDRSVTAGARSLRGGVPAELGPRGTVGRSRSRGPGAGRGGPAPDEGSRDAGRADAARSDRQDRDARSRWSVPDRGDRTAATRGTDDSWASGDGWPVAPEGAADPEGVAVTGAGSVRADRPPATAGDGTSAALAARGRGGVPEVADLLRDRLVPELRARGVIGAAERVDLRDGRGRVPRPGATTLGWTADGTTGGAPATGRGADGRPGSGAETGGVHLHIDRVEVVRPVVEPRAAPASGTREPSRLDAYLERRRTDR